MHTEIPILLFLGLRKVGLNLSRIASPWNCDVMQLLYRNPVFYLFHAVSLGKIRRSRTGVGVLAHTNPNPGFVIIFRILFVHLIIRCTRQ